MSALSNIFSKILHNSGDDIASRVASQYSDDVVRGLAASNADDIAAKHGNLIATHQLTPDKLRGAAELGGFVQPSMAVVDPSKGTGFLPGGDFGDIVMVANRNTIDPKNKLAKTVIGDRDIYSPRFPATKTIPDEKALRQFADDFKMSLQGARTNLDLDNEAVYSAAIRDAFGKLHPEHRGSDISELIDNEAFKDFASSQFDKLRGDKVILQNTPSGNVRHLPLTAENANKVMNKARAVGGEQGFMSPGTRAYFDSAKKIPSLDDLYKNRYRLVDSATGDHTKEAMNDALARLSSKVDDAKLPYLQDDNPYIKMDKTADYVVGGITDPSVRGAMAQDGLSDDIIAEMAEMQQAYKQTPVSYFEAKPRRVVGGDEFYGAYVPQDVPQQVLDDLERLGVSNVNRYTDSDDLDRMLADLAENGKRGVSPYVLGLSGIIPVGGLLASLLGSDSDQTMV